MSWDVEQALDYLLRNTASVSGLCGARIHPLRLPDTAVFPAVVYTEVDAPTLDTHDATADNVMTDGRYQLDAKDVTYSGSVALAKAIFKLLHKYHGDVSDGVNTFTIKGCLRIGRHKDNDPETALFQVIQDFEIWY
jgi:hypothetical protein